MSLRRLFGLVSLVVSFNYLVLSNPSNTTVGWIWLAIAALALWDDLARYLPRR